MKKLLLIITALSLSIMLALSGCSCQPDTPLTFNQNFAGKGNNFELLGATYEEKLTYQVTYEENYASYLKKEDLISKDIIPEYDGVYKTTFKANVKLPDYIANRTDLNFNGGEIHKLSTVLDLNVQTPTQKVYKDKILTDVYFYSIGFSYTPIYSIQTIRNTLPALNNQATDFVYGLSVVQNETIYKQSSYTLTKKTVSETNNDILNTIDLNDLHQNKTGLTLIESKTYNYKPRQVVDNTQLYFMLRNVSVPSSSSYNLPTVTPMYGQVKSVKIRNVDQVTRNAISLDYNGQAMTLDIPLTYYSFAMSGNTNTGLPQIVACQKSAVNDLPYKAFPIEMAQALIEYSSSFATIGVLKYRLTEITVS